MTVVFSSRVGQTFLESRTTNEGLKNLCLLDLSGVRLLMDESSLEKQFLLFLLGLVSDSLQVVISSCTTDLHDDLVRVSSPPLGVLG